MAANDAESPHRILILTPYGKDASQLHKLLGARGFVNFPCQDVPHLISQLSSPTGAILTTQEVLASSAATALITTLQNQPTWSALPILAFYGESNSIEIMLRRADAQGCLLPNLSFIQRPTASSTLINAVKSAMRDRDRQYHIRDLLDRLQKDIAKRRDVEADLKKATEEAIEAKSAAQQASQSKSQFLANMSHEIRTPLGAVMGFLSLMKSPTNTKEDLAEYVSIIDRNSAQLLRIIDDILDLSKVEAGKMLIEYIEFSLADMLSDFASLMGFKAREKGILFDVSFQTPLPECIFADPTRLRQILTNIVGNAIKFTERGRVQLVVSFAQDELTMVVIDTGRGISEEQISHLFQPFTQADSTTTRQFGGTGLGLVLTKRLCEAMDGKFTLQWSELGKGSAFVAKVRAPSAAQSKSFSRVHQRVPVPSTSKTETPILEGLQVLFVEDSPDNQALISILLKKQGALVDIASNGREGVEKALCGSHNVVLMDVQMPYMDGHEATRVLRKQGFKTPIIALTAHAMKEERERTVASGFTDFLSKPINRKQLIDMIVRHGQAGLYS